MKKLILSVWKAFYKFSFGAINFVVAESDDHNTLYIQFQSLDVAEIECVNEFIDKFFKTNRPTLVDSPVVKSKHIGFTCNHYIALDPNKLPKELL